MKRQTLGVVVAICLAVLLLAAGKIFENVDADEILVVQSPIEGTLTWYNSAGIKWQGLGKVTTYEKRRHYQFEQPIRFNDAGKADLTGSIQWEMPLDNENLTALHTRYGSPSAVEQQLISKALVKAVYNTGPLMSSRQSYAEKRPALLYYVEDQIQGGIYRTKQHSEKIKDPITGETKTVTLVSVLTDAKGNSLRQEQPPLTTFGIRTFNFAVESIAYEDRVNQQIAKQQELNMAVQTAIAASRKAEQEKLTAEQQGLANVMTAKYEKEVEKQKAVVEAQQRLDVAKLDKLAAEQKKQEQILLGQGEAERKRLVLKADGALEKKLDAWVKAQGFYANAIKDYQGNWVPVTVMGRDGSSQSGGGALQLLDLLTAKTAKDLSLDMTMPKGATASAR